MLKKEWFKGTSLYPSTDKVGMKGTIDYSTVELSTAPTLLNKGISKNFELLWCASTKLEMICGTEGHVVARIRKNGSEEIAHIFRDEIIQFVKDHPENQEYQLVIKSRFPLADPGVFFHEIRHIETLKKEF